MSCLGKIDERAAVRVRLPIIGNTIGSAFSGQSGTRFIDASGDEDILSSASVGDSAQGLDYAAAIAAGMSEADPSISGGVQVAGPVPAAASGLAFQNGAPVPTNSVGEVVVTAQRPSLWQQILNYIGGGINYLVGENNSTTSYYQNLYSDYAPSVGMASHPNSKASNPLAPVFTNPSQMTISQQGISFIQGYEKYSPVVYTSDGANQPTIGWGHLVTSPGAFPNGITPAQGQAMFMSDLQSHQSLVQNNVNVPLSQNQFDALVSLSYNAPRALEDSTLLNDLNSGDVNGAAQQILVWDKVHLNGVLTVSNGLLARREAEQNIFVNGVYNSNH